MLELAGSLDPGLTASFSHAFGGVQGIRRGKKKLGFTQQAGKKREGKGVRNPGMESSK